MLKDEFLDQNNIPELLRDIAIKLDKLIELQREANESLDDIEVNTCGVDNRGP